MKDKQYYKEMYAKKGKKMTDESIIRMHFGWLRDKIDNLNYEELSIQENIFIIETLKHANSCISIITKDEERD